ncbi:DUF4249 domain-containing protein [Larkinella sp. GY13]|uniref:DUF4249 domain-containing protein n=1 Tax=Larkinella sp. GY13 TaxID=3453720 RepID=UPI003EE87D26
MKKGIYWLLMLTLPWLSACEKIITPELNSGEPRIVIEGNVTSEAGPYTVRVSQTADYYQPGQPQGVSGALVIIRDLQGGLDTLTNEGNGNYRTRKTRGVVGHTYELTVTINGTTYTARSTMPPVVKLDSLTFEAQTLGDIIYANYTDPASVTNYYRWVMYVNDQKQSDVFAADDRLNNGLKTRQALFLTSNTSTDLEPGDRVRVEMQGIDANVYTYFFALSQVLGSGNNQAATPANPPTNLSGDALGYFSAYSVTASQLTVP